MIQCGPAYQYYASTTATSSTPGGVLGRLETQAVQQGETGTEVPQLSRAYLSRTANNVTIYPLGSETLYRNANGTGAQTTTYAYTWFSGAVQAESITTTLPTVTTAQNGPNSATSGVTYFDSNGRMIWSKDAAGFLTYTAYDAVTGAVVKHIDDVNTTQTSTFTGLPSGWSTPSGGGLHRTTTYAVDHLGRATQMTSPAGRVTYAVYKDADHEMRVYTGWASGSPTGPTVVYRDDRARGYTETLTMNATPATSSGAPTGSEAISGVQSLNRSYVNAAGQTVSTDAYFNLVGLSYSTATYIGTLNTNYYRTTFGYGKQAGKQNKSVSPQGTIYRTEYDSLGRPVSEWVGTDDVPTTGFWAPSNLTGTDMVQTAAYEYDQGGVGDSNLTRLTQKPGGSAADRVTEYFYDWRDRLVAQKDGVQTSEGTSGNRPIWYFTLDNLGQRTLTRRYDGDGVSLTSTAGVPNPPSASLLRAQSGASFDELGRVYATTQYSVDPSSGVVGTYSLTAAIWYDLRGLAVKQSQPGGLVTKWAYNGVGEVTTSYTSDGGGDSAYSDADDVTSDTVLEQFETTYDADGLVLTQTTRQRFHNASGTGALGSPTSGIGARASYAGFYYDNAGRLTASVDVGTNGGSAWTRPTNVPSRSDTVLVQSQTYTAAGWLYESTDPLGLVDRLAYDALGRVTQSIESYTDGTVSDGDDRTTNFTYNGNNDVLAVSVALTGGGAQTTGYVYGVTPSDGSTLTSNDVLRVVQYPDPSTGAASSSQQDTRSVNRVGDTLTKTDRNGNVHTLSYDVLGRLTTDAVTTLGSGVDGAVRRIETAFDGQGNASLFTQYSAASGGSVVNQVQRDYNGLGQLITEWQEYNGVVTSSTKKVQYTYSAMSGGANHSRLTSMVYPTGFTVNYTYASGLDATISRLSSLTNSSTTLESYTYLGLDSVVKRAHPEPGVDLTYIKLSGESDGDAGDQYTGLDRFGRVVDQRWITVSTGVAVDRFQYGYDRNSNRLYRENLVDSTFSELYHANGSSAGYDALDQMTEVRRGTLNATKDTITTSSRTQSWDLDATGNWESVTTNGTTETRGHNRQNEITSISGASNVTHDANGNTTQDGTGQSYTLDAWNRLVKIMGSESILAQYVPDALNRRLVVSTGATNRYLYYSAAWQVVEEYSGTPESEQPAYDARYVWSPVYVDALVLRETASTRWRYVVQDANFNVTALMNRTGVVDERYVYDAFGTRTVLNASWVTQSGSSYAWVYGWQGFRQELGLAWARMRDVNSTTGRPLQMDPLGFGAGDVNWYRWEGNNTATYLDPSGLILPALGAYWLLGAGVGLLGVALLPGAAQAPSPTDPHMQPVVDEAAQVFLMFVLCRGMPGGAGVAGGAGGVRGVTPTTQVATRLPAGTNGVPKPTAPPQTGRNGVPTGQRCFPAGTLIHTGHGLRIIEDIRVGEQVWAYNHQYLRWETREVVDVYELQHQGPMATLMIEGETIRATGGHPFWVIRGEGLAERPKPVKINAYEVNGQQEGRWVLAQDLRVGDELLLRTCEVVSLKVVQLETVEETVYNFAVAELQNYAVGICGVLVHNTNDPTTSKPAPRSNDLPAKGKPNSTAVKEKGDGVNGQIREYGPDGRAVKDLDLGHDYEGAGDPHAHDWDWTKIPPRQPARPLKPGE